MMRRRFYTLIESSNIIPMNIDVYAGGLVVSKVSCNAFALVNPRSFPARRCRLRRRCLLMSLIRLMTLV
jgi:hypothetical protein